MEPRRAEPEEERESSVAVANMGGCGHVRGGTIEMGAGPSPGGSEREERTCREGGERPIRTARDEQDASWRGCWSATRLWRLRTS